MNSEHIHKTVVEVVEAALCVVTRARRLVSPSETATAPGCSVVYAAYEMPFKNMLVTASLNRQLVL